MAIETRVHNIWNNLIESASHATGSLLIWDTGEYEVLPRKQEHNTRSTDDELSDDNTDQTQDTRTHSERLFTSFQSRHIRLRLHGSRLPHNYTIALRLPSANDRSGQPKKPIRKRRRVDPSKPTKPKPSDSTGSEASDSELALSVTTPFTEDAAAALASEEESNEDEDSTIRANNAYSGAINTIGSVHQRNWFLTLDRRNSGFRKDRKSNRWVGDWEAFFVRGREYERSVVTGRTADEVMEDEGVEKFVGRKMWRPIME
ncbi:uncharacterized protein LTR77_004120 [Saxophila tyrrhenica]|uniref:DNA ligase D 3'-phosphoesterase domain-containing protein n=1 Tax=Saxophila tyrrhenica TaxID=1690608 RepID=A0AAV9PCQ1_9PEZI|nr:hypothetical protein LTR77_004120 [Saxophila tyrrhenica]